MPLLLRESPGLRSSFRDQSRDRTHASTPLLAVESKNPQRPMRSPAPDETRAQETEFAGGSAPSRFSSFAQRLARVSWAGRERRQAGWRQHPWLCSLPPMHLRRPTQARRRRSRSSCRTRRRTSSALTIAAFRRSAAARCRGRIVATSRAGRARQPGRIGLRRRRSGNSPLPPERGRRSQPSLERSSGRAQSRTRLASARSPAPFGVTRRCRSSAASRSGVARAGPAPGARRGDR